VYKRALNVHTHTHTHTHTRTLLLVITSIRCRTNRFRTNWWRGGGGGVSCAIYTRTEAAVGGSGAGVANPTLGCHPRKKLFFSPRRPPPLPTRHNSHYCCCRVGHIPRADSLWVLIYNIYVYIYYSTIMYTYPAYAHTRKEDRCRPRLIKYNNIPMRYVRISNFAGLKKKII